MPRPSNKEDRQREIVSGLMRVMAERGYEKASIQAIAGAAGLTAGLVHYHFRSKQEVLLALVERLVGLMRMRLERRLADARDPWDRLDAYIDAYLALDESSDAEAVACWVAIGAEALRQPEVKSTYRQTIRAELEALEQLVRDVLVRDGGAIERARDIAAALLSAVQGAYQLAVVAEVTPPGFAAATTKQMARGLVATEVLR
jgi:TetR/AcrR family transcriptional regulator, transcriptional repressor of bet genes